MASTTNYSWTTPDDTALVKDGAAAIRSLGSAIDSTVFTNAGAAINKTIVDAKGDIIAATAADTVARLAVGANDTVLTADSSTATGLKWAAVAAGPVQLATASLAGVSTYTFSNISGSYKTLFLRLTGAYDNVGSTLQMQLNGSSATAYRRTYMDSDNATNVNNNSTSQWGILLMTNDVGSGTSAFELYFPNYTATTMPKSYYGYVQNGDGPARWHIGRNSTLATSAISSITVNASGNTFTAGTLTLFGVN